MFGLDVGNPCPSPDCLKIEWNVVLLHTNVTPGTSEVQSVHAGLEWLASVCWRIYSRWHCSTCGLAPCVMMIWDQSSCRLALCAVMMICQESVFSVWLFTQLHFSKDERSIMGWSTLLDENKFNQLRFISLIMRQSPLMKKMTKYASSRVLSICSVVKFKGMYVLVVTDKWWNVK